jgi:hypothetical protein
MIAATFSPCRTYRYTLTRSARIRHAMKSTAVFCMLNPSTADETQDDPTIRRCRGYADAWDCNGVTILNVYAYRSTDPKALRQVADPVGVDNNYWLAKVAAEAGDIVCAWGKHADRIRVITVADILRRAGARLWCLGTNKDGSPVHPLYQPRDAQLISWSPPE